ncbi:MAG: protein-(glutamine-N5) methyltransferase, release factor-specific [Candidatus Cloacimonadota bacterium]|nr:MAG: protein-(glutamine-N5) methyltransferase, release factor-specific [Candidatus Cloacimonadota bacterium]PIE77428.1 MAG: protein-(glutamine-N5) methyltransferase, release factor-specific [Candidatus Delongbacteria bacterium]
MTYKLLDIINLSREYLEKNGFENGRFEAETLISNYYNMKRLDLYLQFDKPVTESEKLDLRKLIARRKNHEPIQHIIGSSGFMGYDFKVSKDVLIPRFDTETLVEKVSDYIGERELKILDIGTGSGAIIISILKLTPNSRGIGIDISEKGLEIAKINSVNLKVDSRVSFFKKDIFEEFRVKEKFDIVVSNPPYIAKNEMEYLDREVAFFEPRSALTDDGDGLSFYRRIKDLLPTILKSDGKFILEYGYKQREDIEGIFKGYNYEIIKDLSGNDRGIFGGFLGNV